MARQFFFHNAASTGVLAFLIALLCLITPTLAGNDTNTFVTYVNANGQTVQLAENRQPALFTGNFGDCLGSSLLSISRFDAAYYKDNMTVVFHLEGTTILPNAAIMLYIEVYAYGESRFELAFNPCNANIFSLCPTNASIPIEAAGIIPVAPSDVAVLPAIALTIPDFEGQAVLRVFSNATESEIGCFSAVVKNGNSFSQPAAVGSILGVFTFIAVVASFATAVYGQHIPTMRTHYAHSLSIFVVFAVWHHIFFTGSLSMNWPSVLPAWWSNFAWTAGMIYSSSMQASINGFTGRKTVNTTIVGGAASSGSSSSDGVAGGYSPSLIYKRASSGVFGRAPTRLEDVLKMANETGTSNALVKRGLENSTTGFTWYGSPAQPGLPLPGNYSGFAGTLSDENIPVSNAFMTGFIWLIILLAIVVGSVALLKWTLEGLSRMKVIHHDRLEFFRAHWLRYVAMAALRTTFIAFFMMIFLTLFQFVDKGPAGVTAIAAIVFLIFFVGLLGVAGMACYSRLQFGHYTVNPDRIHLGKTKAFGFLPWYDLTRESKRTKDENPYPSAGSLPWWRVSFVSTDPQRVQVHEDEDYILKYGWLSARFRKSKWWFFMVWLVYEFVRACFYGAAAGQPLTQVFGLLAVEFIALFMIIKMRPFEGARLNAIMVYLLGFSKVATLALASAFDPRFNLPRIITTVLGVVIIVIQGLLTIVLMVAIVVGAISSYMSMTRNRESFSPKSWAPYRERYFLHMDRAATDRPPTPPPPPPAPEEPKAPYFNVGSIRRLPKIEDEDDEHMDTLNTPLGSRLSVANVGASTPMARTRRNSRANSMLSTMSMSNTNLPFGARPHRQSWSSRDFANWHETGNRDSIHSRIGMQTMRSDSSLRDSYQVPTRSRAPSRGNSIPLEVRKRTTLPSTPGSPTEVPSPIAMNPGEPSGGSRKGKEREVHEDAGPSEFHAM